MGMTQKKAIQIAVKKLQQEMSKLYHYMADYDRNKRYFSEAHKKACERYLELVEAVKVLESIGSQGRLF